MTRHPRPTLDDLEREIEDEKRRVRALLSSTVDSRRIETLAYRYHELSDLQGRLGSITRDSERLDTDLCNLRRMIDKTHKEQIAAGGGYAPLVVTSSDDGKLVEVQLPGESIEDLIHRVGVAMAERRSERGQDRTSDAVREQAAREEIELTRQAEPKR